jgi:predicted nicotinamide N-methyase
MNNITDIKTLPFFPKKFNISTEYYSLDFFCPDNPDIVLDSISNSDYNKDQFLPYWAEHWPSAQIFLTYILQQSFKPDIEVCELGCGLGIISTAFLIRKCKTLSVDISHQACRYAFENISLNGYSPKVICGDWRNIGLKKKFDLIAASDILYEFRWIDPVLSCIDSLLSNGGKAWIADPCRRYWIRFKNRAKEYGFAIKTIKYEYVENRKINIEILEISRRNK